jgi:hypothetical protein
MSKAISLQICGIVLDVLYRNSEKVRLSQKSLAELAKDAGVSVLPLQKVRSILIERQLLVTYGFGRGQYTAWNPNKSKPNPNMLVSIYQEYIKDAKHKVKVVAKKEGRVSLERALKTLVKLGYTGVISKSINSFTSECIDLSKIEVED